MSKILSLCAREGFFDLGSSIHSSIVKNTYFFDLQNNLNSKDVLVIWNSLLVMYSKCGHFNGAAKLFDKMPMRDTVSWNTMLSAILSNGDSAEGFMFLKQMRESAFYYFDQETLTTIVSSCNRPELSFATIMVHFGVSLITFYCKSGGPDFGGQVFDEMLKRSVNMSLLGQLSFPGYQKTNNSSDFQESLRLFKQMRIGIIEPNVLTCLS